ncbi:MAG: 50S ribosomal protein L11 methyltransferase [Bacteroidia bacterium]
MNYYCFHFKVNPVQPGSEILIAHLSELGFDTFENTDDGLKAFIREELLDENAVKELGEFDFTYSYTFEKIEQKNWNEEWEKNFSPVYVDDKCCIRASFHPEPENVQQDILITPKMSFGTGHHDTTWLMSEALFYLDIKGKEVLDMGCGTGVLAILAKKLGSGRTVAIDIDQWSYENTVENCEMNSCTDIIVKRGDRSLLTGEHFDIILANINRNILLNDMETYMHSLNRGGYILFSGFFESDIPELERKAVSLGLKKVEAKLRSNWAMLKYSYS